MDRIYDTVLAEHFQHEKNMAFLAGPRQSGKTTTAVQFKPKQSIYWNWDNIDDRAFLRSSPAKFLEEVDKRQEKGDIFVLDELHKNPKWRTWLKGFYDKYHQDYSFIITGSARLNVFHRGGDSLLGRYYLYRHHPLSLGELSHSPFESTLFRTPRPQDSIWKKLMKFGGFPKPFLVGTESSHLKWLRMRRELLIREDLRDLSRIEDIAAIELLVKLLTQRAGGILNYQNLSNDIHCSVDSIRRWIQFLEYLYYLYRIPPYTKNLKRSLKKSAKLYLWDWSEITDESARFENMIASHLLKAVHYWTDTGKGNFELYYIRDKQKREVDFLVLREDEPFLLAEAKLSEKNLSPSLAYYAAQLRPKYSFQVVHHLKAQGISFQEAKFNDLISGQDFCGNLV